MLLGELHQTGFRIQLVLWLQ